MSSLFGAITSGDQVRKAVTTTIRLWADTYLAEMSRRSGLELPPIRAYTTALSVDPDAQNDYPACVVVAPGILGEPERQGDGTHDVTWAVGVGIVVSGPTADDAIALCEPYTAALRALMVQQGSLGGFAVETTWLDEETRQIAYERDRSVAAGSLQFAVQLSGVLNRWGGPITPPADPTVPLDTVPVSVTDVMITKEPL